MTTITFSDKLRDLVFRAKNLAKTRTDDNRYYNSLKILLEDYSRLGFSAGRLSASDLYHLFQKVICGDTSQIDYHPRVNEVGDKIIIKI